MKCCPLWHSQLDIDRVITGHTPFPFVIMARQVHHYHRWLNNQDTAHGSLMLSWWSWKAEATLTFTAYFTNVIPCLTTDEIIDIMTLYLHSNVHQLYKEKSQ